MEKYILRAYYKAADGRRILADFVVTNPCVCRDGIWATSRTAWGGETRHFYHNCDVVWLSQDNNDTINK